MKRVRWDGAHFRVSNGEPECRLMFSEDIIDCEKHAEWREIESGTLDMESGKLRLVLKPVEKSFAEEMAEFFRRYWPLAWDGGDGGSFVRSVIAAVKRELASPAKPPRYTDEAVDALLIAVRAFGDKDCPCVETIDFNYYWKALVRLQEESRRAAR